MSVQGSRGSKPSLNKKRFPILAIDYGEKRFGIAISDSKGIVSTSLGTLSISKNIGIGDIIEQIRVITTQNRVSSILLGLPQAFEKAYEINRDRIKRFGQMISEATGLEVYYYDESYSSKQATAVMIETGKTRTQRRKDVDSVAAALFLQEYLDGNNSKQLQNRNR